MKRFPVALLAIGLATASGGAFAQSTYYPAGNGYDRHDQGRYDQQGEAYYDYARVIRVDPVLDGSYNRTSSYNGQRCYETTTAGSYERDGYYRNDGYRNDGYYGNDAYGRSQYGGSNTGRTVATVVGGIAGAVLGSKVGGGTGAYAATAIGSMVGGMAGRKIYDQTQQDRYVRPGVVRVCDPEPVGGGYRNDGYGSYRAGNANAYDVTYEYNGRRYTRRMDYNPGDRVRVRVDVAPQ